MKIYNALQSLGFGDKIIKIIGGDYDGIEWVNGEVLATREQVETEIQRLEAEEISKKYQELRAAEYPDFRDYLDGIVKGDQNQIQAYINACLAVKAKYPKPEDN